MPVPSIQTNAFSQGFDLPDLKNSVEFVRGGFWRNFKVRYPETNEMYARMQMVSQRLQQPLQCAR